MLSLAALGAFSISNGRSGETARSQGWAYVRWSESNRPRPPVATRPMVPAVDEDLKLDIAERQRVIHAVIANLKRHYIDPAVAQKVANALLAHENGGDYDAVTDGAAFAGLLTRQMRDVSHDMHLIVDYSRAPTPDRPPGPAPEDLARYRKAMVRENCTFETAEILPHNIGYLKLNSFPDPAICQTTARAAMGSLNARMRSSSICGTTVAGIRAWSCQSPPICSIIRSTCTPPGKIRRSGPGRGRTFRETDWRTSRYMC